jgi:hypothetical protein
MPITPADTSAVLARLITAPATLAAADLDLPTVQAAVWHGVAPLVYHAIAAAGSAAALGRDVRDELRRHATEAVAIEAVRHDHLRLTLDALGRAGVEPIVFKGAALAASHYPDPWLRPRGDTDLLIAPSQLERVNAALETLGFWRTPRPAGRWITHQARYVGAHGGVTLAYDVHWRLSDPHAFAHVLAYDEIRAAARVLPHITARAPSDEHALLIAAVHRAAHHYGSEQLILLYDVHVLASQLTSAQWNTFAALAGARLVRSVGLAALRQAHDLFGTIIPDDVLGQLSAQRGQEPTARYLDASFRKIDILQDDLRSARGAERLRLLRQHLFPSGDYMKAMYGVSGRSGAAMLPLLYARRIVRGSIRWFRPLRPSAPLAGKPMQP